MIHEHYSCNITVCPSLLNYLLYFQWNELFENHKCCWKDKHFVILKFLLHISWEISLCQLALPRKSQVFEAISRTLLSGMCSVHWEVWWQTNYRLGLFSMAVWANPPPHGFCEEYDLWSLHLHSGQSLIHFIPAYQIVFRLKWHNCTYRISV